MIKFGFIQYDKRRYFLIYELLNKIIKKCDMINELLNKIIKEKVKISNLIISYNNRKWNKYNFIIELFYIA